MMKMDANNAIEISALTSLAAMACFCCIICRSSGSFKIKF